jgi:hypothetical protein
MIATAVPSTASDESQRVGVTWTGSPSAGGASPRSVAASLGSGVTSVVGARPAASTAVAAAMVVVPEGERAAHAVSSSMAGWLAGARRADGPASPTDPVRSPATVALRRATTLVQVVR